MTTNETKIKQLEEFIKTLQDDDANLNALLSHYGMLINRGLEDRFKLILLQTRLELEVQSLKIVELCLTGK